MPWGRGVFAFFAIVIARRVIRLQANDRYDSPAGSATDGPDCVGRDDAACDVDALRLRDTSASVERTLKTYETLRARFAGNYNALWGKYQSNKKVLYKHRGVQECLNRQICDLNGTNETVTRRLREQEENNERLKTSSGRLEKMLRKEKDNAARLHDQIQNQKTCLEKTFGELSDAKQMLDAANGELAEKTEERRKLTSALEAHKDRLSRAVEKHTIEKLQLIKNNNIVSTELDIQKYRNAELNKTVREQKCQLQQQTESLEKSNEQNQVLKQIIAKEMIQANESIDKLRKDKLNITNEKEELEKKLEEHAKAFESLGHENEQLKTQINETQFKLDAVVKNGDEKLKSLTEKMANVDEERRQLNVEMTSMNQINAELEKRLSEAKKMHNVEAENVYNLERRLKNVCQRLNKCSQCSNKSPASTGPFFHNQTKALDELKPTGERSGLKSEHDCTESISNFEKLISKCESIINSFNK